MEMDSVEHAVAKNLNRITVPVVCVLNYEFGKTMIAWEKNWIPLIKDQAVYVEYDSLLPTTASIKRDNRLSGFCHSCSKGSFMCFWKGECFACLASQSKESCNS